MMLKTVYAISVHVDRPAPRRFSISEDWHSAFHEVSRRTASPFGVTTLGLHNGPRSEFMTFAALAHRATPRGSLITPTNPSDRLFEKNGRPLPNALHKWVAGTVFTDVARRADDHAFFTVSKATYNAVADFARDRQIDPGFFNAIHRNCVKFVLGALDAGKLALPTEGLPRGVARLRRPEDMSSAIMKATSNGKITIAHRPTILGEATIQNLVA